MSEGFKQYGGQTQQFQSRTVPQAFVRIELGSVITQGKHYRLLSAPTVTVRGSDGGEKNIKRPVQMLEYDGAFKVSTYSVTPTRAMK